MMKILIIVVLLVVSSPAY
ncbi:type I toxin-antitoxin system Ibs family toxin [Escherichia coli]|nr:type I toxin-antitoxin system Ibs family toxin [Escherichia coli]